MPCAPTHFLTFDLTQAHFARVLKLKLRLWCSESIRLQDSARAFGQRVFVYWMALPQWLGSVHMSEVSY